MKREANYKTSFKLIESVKHDITLYMYEYKRAKATLLPNDFEKLEKKLQLSA